MTDEGHRWKPDELRTTFSLALSEMYRAEVPLYGTLVQIVRDVDCSVLKAQGREVDELPIRHQIERHGAIRLGSDTELHTIKRLFALFGMYPVGYYDLQSCNLPLHATAFRPISEMSLQRNPFRVFTSVLCKGLLPTNIQALSTELLKRRQLFSPRLLQIIDSAERTRQMTVQDTKDLITESLNIFKWHWRSTVSIDDYLELKSNHPMVADIVCFPSAHINHLTPRTLDIDRVQQEMTRQGLPAKERIEGPPARRCPILLRQTSFKALEEVVTFSSPALAPVQGTHTARFGEVEQRGAAVTPKGRALYDELWLTASKLAAENHNRKAGDSDDPWPLRSSTPPHAFDSALTETFSRFPDSWAELRERDLVYFRYRVASSVEDGSAIQERAKSMNLEQLVSDGLLKYEPITYEDFLPLSAAGIFQSNLGDAANASQQMNSRGGDRLSELEGALGCSVLHELDLYEELQLDSLAECAKELGVDEIVR